MNRRCAIIIDIPGEPKGKDRHRSTKTGHIYSPGSNRDYEKEVKYAYKQQCKKIFVGELNVEIDAYFKIPNSWSKKKKNLALDGIINPTKKPDADNIAKMILDSLNGIAYKDDSAVTCCKITKRYAEVPFVRVYISGEIDSASY